MNRVILAVITVILILLVVFVVYKIWTYQYPTYIPPHYHMHNKPDILSSNPTASSETLEEKYNIDANDITLDDVVGIKIPNANNIEKVTEENIPDDLTKPINTPSTEPIRVRMGRFIGRELERQITNHMYPIHTRQRPRTPMARIFVNGGEAGATSESKIKKPDKKDPEYFEKMQKHKQEDSQSVHNSHVRNELGRKIKRLFDLNEETQNFQELVKAGVPLSDIKRQSITQSLNEIRTRFKVYFEGQMLKGNSSEKESETKIRKIEMFLKEVESNSGILYPLQTGEEMTLVKESWLLSQVWYRIHQPANFNRRYDLEVALFDQMVDGVEIVQEVEDLIQQIIPGDQEHTAHVVCPNGRTSRVMETFTLLDADKILAQPIRDEQELANEIYTKSYKILQDALKETKINLPGCEKTIDDLYNASEDKLSMREKLIVGNFEKKVKENIREFIMTDYKDIVEPLKLEEYVENAQAGV